MGNPNLLLEDGSASMGMYSSGAGAGHHDLFNDFLNNASQNNYEQSRGGEDLIIEAFDMQDLF